MPSRVLHQLASVVLRRAVCATLLCVVAGAAACGPDADGISLDASLLPTDANPLEPPDARAAPAALRIDDVEPAYGAYLGGTKVGLRGLGFREGMTVSFGGRDVEALDVIVVDQRRAYVVTPPGEPGPVDVTVHQGDLSAVREAAFHYERLAVDPTSGPISGGTRVRIFGRGTSFGPGDLATVGGMPLADLEIVSAGELVGTTLPHAEGVFDVAVTTAGGTLVAQDAFSFTSTSDSNSGGFGGPVVDGQVNVAVVDAYTDNGVDGAFVLVSAPDRTLSGTADDFGHLTLSDVGLTGPLTVTASAPGYEAASFVAYDSRDLTVFLVPLPTPVPGGDPPPGRLRGILVGNVVFESVTGASSPVWTLVPEPRTPTEKKRIWVYTSSSSYLGAPPSPEEGGIIDFTGDGRTAWPFQITARPAALAVMAVAGLWDPARDPDGAGPLAAGVFQPYAMGVKRGLLVGPGEVLENIVINVDHGLDAALSLAVDAPSPLDPTLGPDQVIVQASVDLGGEGSLKLPGSRLRLPAGAGSLVMTGLPTLAANLGDASYTVVAGSYTGDGGIPLSVRIERGWRDLSVPRRIGDFLGVPRGTDPLSGGVASGLALHYQPDSGPTATPSFYQHILSASSDGRPLWHIIARGDQLDVELPDLAMAAGLPPLPAGEVVNWVTYSVTVPGLDFDHWNYSYLNSLRWSAYTTQISSFSFPVAP